MITIYVLNAIIIGHFIADYVFQNRFIKKNKLLMMLIHSLMYMVFFGVIFYAATFKMYDASLILQYVILNGLLHYAVDVIVDIVKNIYNKQDYEDLGNIGFFTTIGFDQLIHISILFHTYVYMFN